MTSREQASLAIINLSRRYFRNTWVHRLPITSKVYKKLFLSTFKDTERTIVFRGNKFVVPTKDTTVVPSMISGEYEVYELDIFKKLVKNKSTILDIGANLGVYSIEAAQYIDKKGQVYAFEPVPQNQELLKRNIELNHLNNIKVIPDAVGGKNDNIRIYLAENSIGTHSAGLKSENFINTKVITIDSFVKKKKTKIDLIKMDIEGFEGYAVEGGLSVLKSQKPILFIEFSSKHLLKCDYDPAKHAKNLLKLYKYCYIINERQKKIQITTSIEELTKLNNDNLVLSQHKINF